MENKVMDVSTEELEALKGKLMEYNNQKQKRVETERELEQAKEERMALEQQLETKTAGESRGK